MSALAYQLDGSPDGPALLLASSLGTDRDCWARVLAAWAPARRIVRFDHRGHGRSPAPAGAYAIADLGADVLELMDALDLRSCDFCGISLGGMVGLWLAANAPERIARLIVCASSAHMPPQERWQERARAVRRARSTAPIADGVVERWLTPGFRAAHADVHAELLRMLLATPASGYASCCEAIAAMDLRAELPRIRAPTLVVCGAQDSAAPAAEHGEPLARALRDSRIETLSPAAHLLCVERPRQLAALIADHLGPEGGTI